MSTFILPLFVSCLDLVINNVHVVHSSQSGYEINVIYKYGNDYMSIITHLT